MEKVKHDRKREDGGERKTRVSEDDWGKANRGGPDKVNEDKCIKEPRKEVTLWYKGEKKRK